MYICIIHTHFFLLRNFKFRKFISKLYSFQTLNFIYYYNRNLGSILFPNFSAFHYLSITIATPIHILIKLLKLFYFFNNVFNECLKTTAQSVFEKRKIYFQNLTAPKIVSKRKNGFLSAFFCLEAKTISSTLDKTLLHAV